jgi:hypothetical protein
VHNGQQTVLEKRTPAQFVRSVRWTPGMAPGFQPLMTQMDEGYTLSISFLDSLDGRTVETAINCEVDQIEKLTGIRIPVPGIGNNGGTFGMNAAGEKMNLQIPQIVSWRLQERIRWPVNEVLLVSCGVVAVPNAEKGRSLATILDNRSSRADALLFIDFRGAENPRTAQVAPVNSNLQALPPK